MTYQVYATRDSQLVQFTRKGAHETFATVRRLRALGWKVTVSR